MAKNNGSQLIGAAELLGKKGVRFAEFELPDGSRVRCRSLTARQCREVVDSTMDADGNAIQARQGKLEQLLVSRSLVDADGQPFLTDEDVMGGKLDKLDSLVLNSIVRAVLEHTGFNHRLTLEAVKGEAKN